MSISNSCLHVLIKHILLGCKLPCKLLGSTKAKFVLSQCMYSWHQLWVGCCGFYGPCTSTLHLYHGRPAQSTGKARLSGTRHSAGDRKGTSPGRSFPLSVCLPFRLEGTLARRVDQGLVLVQVLKGLHDKQSWIAPPCKWLKHSVGRKQWRGLDVIHHIYVILLTSGCYAAPHLNTISNIISMHPVG